MSTNRSAIVKPVAKIVAGGLLAMVLLYVIGYFIGFHQTAIVSPEPYISGEGYKYCVRLADSARLTAWKETVGGYILGVAGLLLVTIGAVIGPDANATSEFRKYRNIFATVVGGLLLATSHYGFARADAASLASAASTMALIEISDEGSPQSKGHSLRLSDDLQAFGRCIQIRSAWLNSRVESSEIVTTAFSKAEKDQDHEAKPATNPEEKTPAPH